MIDRSATARWRPPSAGEVVVVPGEEFAERASERLAALLREGAMESSGTVSVALAGGNTPRPVYELLARVEDVPWARIEIFFSDERVVPADDAESNYGMAREALLERVSIPGTHIHRMRTELEAPGQAAHDYASVLPPSLDVVLLGIGTDGHTASLFPGSDALRARQRVVPSWGPAPPQSRLTVTPPVLAAARRLVVLASGGAKAGAVARALTGPWDPEACPAQLARRGLWILDVDAASALPRDVRADPVAPVGESA